MRKREQIVARSNFTSDAMRVIPTDTRFDTRLFYLIAGSFLGVFLLWGIFAELNSGAIAMGEVIPAGRVKTIQHLEGGIIREILVKEGDPVKAGAVLLRLEETEARASVAISEADHAAQNALVARLSAERDGKPYRPTAELAASPSVAAQLRLFESRRMALGKELAGLTSRLADTRREQQSWEAKAQALNEMQANADEESKLNRRLYEQNFIARPRLLQLESQRADTSARLSENSAEIARARQRIADTEVSLGKLKNDWMNALLEELRRAEEAAVKAQEQAAVARDRLARTQILAPQDGVVNGLKYSTVGGVIPPGGVILEVVPAAEELVVEARVMPDDIDVVQSGLAVRVKLTAYKARSHITLRGKVIHVSGSTFRDESSQGNPYYKARIEIGPDELKKIDRGLLTPGMLAQVEVVAGQRSALRYLLDPITDSIGRAFKES
jgi:HlyD family type I secretion membrane fusion protein